MSCSFSCGEFLNAFTEILVYNDFMSRLSRYLFSMFKLLILLSKSTEFLMCQRERITFCVKILQCYEGTNPIPKVIARREITQIWTRTLPTKIECLKTLSFFCLFHFIIHSPWWLTLANKSIYKIILSKPCVFLTVYIFIHSDLFPVFPYIHIYI